MTRPWFAATGSPLRAWSGLLLVVTARAYRALVITLLAVAVLPMAWGWRSYAVHSSSMEPSLSIGDVVVASPVHDTARVGRVMVFTSPATGRTMVHRVVARLSDGRYTTAGDATPARDPEPVPPSAFSHQGRLLVPYVALPAIWWSGHRYPLLAGWGLLTIAAFLVASRRTYAPRHRPRHDQPHVPRARGLAQPHRHRPVRHVHAHGTAIAVLALLGSCAVILQQAAPARAAAHFSRTTGDAGNSWGVSTRILQPYTSAVLTDSPYLFYRLDEAGGTFVSDSSGNGRDGTYAAVSAYQQSGALPGDFGYSIALAGNQGRVVGGGTGQSNPTSFTVEMWFKTTTTAGGRLFGFDSTKNATSGTYDRYLQMQTGGRLVYGNWNNGGTKTIVSPLAYNDGKWHYVVITSTGSSPTSTMYVDGAGVVSGSTTKISTFTGYWHFGYGPASSGGTNFTGNIDNVAVYASVLSSTRIAAHYAAR